MKLIFYLLGGQRGGAMFYSSLKNIRIKKRIGVYPENVSSDFGKPGSADE